MAEAVGAPPEQTEFLELRTHCANPDCEGQGLKTCNRCKRLRYCSVACQRAHWPAHKPECKAPAPKAVTKKKETKEKTETTKEKGEDGAEESEL